MKRSLPLLALSTLVVGLLSQPAYADSAASTIKEQTEKLQKRGGLEDLQNYCKAKSKLKVSIDAKSFSKAIGNAKYEDKVEDNIYRRCSNPLTALKDWCANGYDEAVQKQVSSYVCRFDAGKQSVTLKKGVLTLTTDLEVPPHEWTKHAVGAVLKEGDFTLSQAALIRNDTKRIKSASGDMKRRCKGEVNWSVDWKSFKGELDKRTGSNNLRQVWQNCYEPLRALENLCTNAQTKLMKDQVSSFVCRYDRKSEATMTLEGKVLTLVSNFEKNAGEEAVNNLVGDTLRDGDFSVRQAAFIKAEEAQIQRLYSAEADDKCGTKIAWSVDWKSFEGEINKRLSKEDKTLLYASCGVPLNRLASICGGDRKNKVKAKIKSYSCVYGGPKKQKMALKKGKLQYNVDFTAEDSYGAFDKFLVKNKVIKKRPPPQKLSPKDLARIRRILGSQANTQQCYKACARRKGARAKRQCRSSCQ